METSAGCIFPMVLFDKAGSFAMPPVSPMTHKMKKIASIDIGTNSVLYSLFEARRRNIGVELYFERHSPRIGRQLAGKSRPLITETSYSHLKKILVRNIRHARRNEAEAILLAATNPLRRARNGREIRQRLEKELGERVVILSPDREAFLSFLAAAGRPKKGQKVIVIDLGGGSTELVIYREETRLAFISIPEGAVSLTERFETEGRININDFEKFEKYLSRYDKKALSISPHLGSTVRLVGGTTTALGWLKDSHILEKSRGGVALTPADLDKFVGLLASSNLAERRRLLEIDKKRAEIIFAGAFWCRHLFKLLGINRAAAIPRGLRHGMVMDFLRHGVFTA
jgi:exopolyphosphatase/guanosine-5'-triphosphate,3'-diphosphate pyrophosphatase